MRLTIDRELCVGSAMCVLSTPDLFDQSAEDGRVVLRVTEPGPDDAERVRAAANLCPSGALSVE